MKIKDKDARSEEQFRSLAEQHEKASARAAKVATLARRPAGSEEQTDTEVVRVRAHARPGHSGFRRGGHFWSSDPDGTVALVTPRLLACLEAETMLAVSRDVGDVDRSKLEPLDVPEDFSVPLPKDLGGRQITDRERELEAENARLRQRLQESATQSAPPKPPVDAPPAPAAPAAPVADAEPKGTSKK